MLCNPNSFFCVAVSWLSPSSTYMSRLEKKLSRGMYEGHTFPKGSPCYRMQSKRWQIEFLAITMNKSHCFPVKCIPSRFFSLFTIANGDENWNSLGWRGSPRTKGEKKPTCIVKCPPVKHCSGMRELPPLSKEVVTECDRETTSMSNWTSFLETLLFNHWQHTASQWKSNRQESSNFLSWNSYFASSWLTMCNCSPQEWQTTLPDKAAAVSGSSWAILKTLHFSHSITFLQWKRVEKDAAVFTMWGTNKQLSVIISTWYEYVNYTLYSTYKLTFSC